MGMSSGKKISRRKGRANRSNGLSLEEYVEYQKSYWVCCFIFSVLDTIPIICLVPLVLEMFVPPSNKVIQYWPFIAALAKAPFFLQMVWVVYCSRNRYGEYTGNFDMATQDKVFTSGFNKPLPLRRYLHGALWIVTSLLQTIGFVYFLSFDNMVRRFTFWKLIDGVAIHFCGRFLFHSFIEATVSGTSISYCKEDLRSE